MKRTQIGEAIRTGLNSSISVARSDYRQILNESAVLLPKQRASFIEGKIPVFAERLSRTGCWAMLGDEAGRICGYQQITRHLRDGRVVCVLNFALQCGYNRLSDADLTTISPEDISNDVRDFWAAIKIQQWLHSYLEGDRKRTKGKTLGDLERKQLKRVFNKLKENGYLKQDSDGTLSLDSSLSGEAVGYIFLRVNIIVFGNNEQVQWKVFRQYVSNLKSKYHIDRWVIGFAQGNAKQQEIDTIFNQLQGYGQG